MGRQSRGKVARRSGEQRPASEVGTRINARPAPSLPIADDSTTLTPWSEIWRRDGRALVLLFVVALAYRLLILHQTARSPFLEVDIIDSASYRKWALDIIGGNWWPQRTFYQSPFYAYFLAVLYRLFGPGPWAPRILQILIGSLTPLLAYGIASRLYTKRAGWIAGGLVALYGPIVIEEVTLSKTSPLIVTALAGIAAYLRYGPGGNVGGLALAGVLFGIAMVGVAQWLPAFAVLAVYLPWFVADGRRERRLIAAATFLGAGLLTMAPVVVWNSVNGGGAVLTSGGAGLNFFEGNNERASGLPARPPGLRDIPEYEEDDARRLAEQAIGGPLTPAEVDRYWTGRGFAYIRQNPGDWLALVGRKLTVLWNAYEIPDNYHFAFLRQHFLPALWVSTTFGLVGSLALLGVALPFWRRRGLVAFHLAWLAYMVTPLIYYVRGRYRLPLVPFLAVLAAAGVERAVRAAQARRWDAVMALGAGVLAAGLIVNHTYCEPAHHGFQPLCFRGDVWFDQEWLKLASWYDEHGDGERALDAVKQAGQCSSPRSPGQLVFRRGEAEGRRGDARLAAGDPLGAQEHFRAAELAFRRAVDMSYRTRAANQKLILVQQRIARAR